MSTRIWGMPKRGPYTRKKPQAGTNAQKLNFVREWREHFEMTQEELCAKSGISLASISAYERGANQPKLDKLEMLSKTWNIPRGMILDVDPSANGSLWGAYLRATDAVRKQMDSLATALVGPPPKSRK